jgi:hypothetical protein
MRLDVTLAIVLIGYVFVRIVIELKTVVSIMRFF